MCFSLFGFLDLFRQPVMLYFNGIPKRSSTLGIMTSILIYIFLIYSFFKSDLYKKESPIVVTQETQSPNAAAMYFDDNKIFAFSLSDSVGNRFIDPTIFTIMFRYFYSPVAFELREMRPCVLSDVKNETFFQEYQFGNFLCLKNKSFVLQGDAGSENWHYVAISLFLCDNSTSNNTCKSQAEIDNFFNSFTSQKFFNVFFGDTQISLNNYEKPFLAINTYNFQLVDSAVKKRSYYYFKQATVETDTGWLFPDIRSQSDFMFSSKEMDFQIRTNQNQPIYQYLFFSSRDRVVVSRRYQTIAEFLGGFAGIVRFMIVFCGGVINSFLHINTLKLIINKIYAFPKILKNKKKNLKSCSIQKNLISDLPKNESLNLQKNEKITESRIDEFLKISKKEVLEPMKTENRENFENMNLKLNNEFCKKKLKDDSFVLEHFSVEGMPEMNSEIKENILISEKLEECLETTKVHNDTIIEKNLKTNVENTKNTEENVILAKRMTKSQRMKKSVVSLLDYFYTLKDQNGQNKLKVSYWEYISLFFDHFKKKSSLKNKLIRKAEQTYIEELDVVNIVTKIHDLEKLKILLLDEDQLVLFNYLSKPIISLEKNQDNIREEDGIQSLSQKNMTHFINIGKNAKIHLEESYKKLLQRTDDKLSTKLIGFFDKEVYDSQKLLQSKTKRMPPH